MKHVSERVVFADIGKDIPWTVESYAELQGDLVHLGHYVWFFCFLFFFKAWFGWFISNTNVFLTVLEARNLRSVFQCDRLLTRAVFLNGCVLPWQRQHTLVSSSSKDISWGLYAHDSSKPNHLPKVPLPNTISLGVQATTYEFGEGRKQCGPQQCITTS